MSAHPQPRLTPQEYLKIEREAETRSEYYNGRMYAMAGGSHRHAFIIGNLTGALWIALKKTPCRAASENLRVAVSPDGLYSYPDVVVVCGPLKLLDGHQDTVLNPKLLIEVLSPSTEAYDRGFKAAQYRTLASLQEYALVSQTEPRVEVFRRQASGDWLMSEFIGMDAVCRFDSVDCLIQLSDIYDRIEFSAEQA